MYRATVIACGLCVLGFLAAWGKAAADAEQEDRKLLQGKWKVAERVVEGRRADIELVWTIDGDEIDFGGEIGVWARFTLDPTTEPKTIDIEPVSKLDPKNLGKTIRGIYEVDGDMLKICAPTEAGAEERPTSFESKVGSSISLLVFQRVKEME